MSLWDYAGNIIEIIFWLFCTIVPFYAWEYAENIIEFILLTSLSYFIISGAFYYLYYKSKNSLGNKHILLLCAPTEFDSAIASECINREAFISLFGKHRNEIIGIQESLVFLLGK